MLTSQNKILIAKHADDLVLRGLTKWLRYDKVTTYLINANCGNIRPVELELFFLVILKLIPIFWCGNKQIQTEPVLEPPKHLTS